MQRIQVLLQKINELAQSKGNEIVEVDLMLDYTRVLYADLLEVRNNLMAQQLYVTKDAPAPKPVPRQPAPVATTPVAPAPQPATSQVAAQSEPIRQHAPKEEHISTPAAKSIRNQIGINDKYQFISELFGNDKDEYEKIINHLDTFDNYEAASRWLQTHTHRQLNWDDDHETVISFYATLHMFFNNR